MILTIAVTGFETSTGSSRLVAYYPSRNSAVTMRFLILAALPLKKEVLAIVRTLSPVFTKAKSVPEEYAPVHPNLQGINIDDGPFLDQNLYILFDVLSPISSAGIDEIKQLYIILINIIFVIVTLPPSNNRVL
jgi:hypothetical protein